MAEIQISHDIGAGQIGVAVEKAQGLRLHRAADEKILLLNAVGQIGHQCLAYLFLRRAVEDQSESTLGVVLADQHHSAVKKGAVQLSAVQDEFPL